MSQLVNRPFNIWHLEVYLKWSGALLFSSAVSTANQNKFKLYPCYSYISDDPSLWHWEPAPGCLLMSFLANPWVYQPVDQTHMQLDVDDPRIIDWRVSIEELWQYMNALRVHRFIISHLSPGIKVHIYGCKSGWIWSCLALHFKSWMSEGHWRGSRGLHDAHYF